MRQRGMSLALSLAMIMAAAPSASWAQEAVELGDARDAATLSASEVAEAEAAFFKGLAAYRAGKFDEAVASFQKAYDISKHRDMLFNLGRSHEGKGDKAAAVKAYRTYLGTSPVDETAIIQRIRVLGGDPTPIGKKTDEKGTGEGTGEVPIGPEPVAHETNPWPWVVMGVGAVGVGVGTFLGLQALSDADAAREESTRDAAEIKRDDAESGALLADISMGVGIAAVGAGLLWLLLDEPEEQSERVEIQASGTHIGIGFSGSF